MRRSLHVLLFAVRATWAGRSLPQNASPLHALLRVRLVALSSPSGNLLSIVIWPVEGNLSAAVKLCFLLLFVPLSIHVSIPVSSQCLVFLRRLSFPALALLPSKLKGLSHMWCLSPFSPSVLPNLGWKLCCTHLLFRSPLDTCSVNVFVFETVYLQKEKKTTQCWRWNFLLLCLGKEVFGSRWQHLHD